MTYLSIGFLLTFLIPVFIGSWRVGFLGLAAQGLILGFAVLGLAHELDWAVLIQAIDLILIRGIVMPAVLISVIRKLAIAPEFKFIPATFLYRMVQVLIVGVGLWFGHFLFPGDLQRALTVGAGAGAITTSFLILSLQPPGIGQLFAILLLESSIVLVEVLSPHHFNPCIEAGVSGLFLAFIFVAAMFLRKLPVLTSNDPSDVDKDLI